MPYGKIPSAAKLPVFFGVEQKIFDPARFGLDPALGGAPIRMTNSHPAR
jgi:hypothetical protein